MRQQLQPGGYLDFLTKAELMEGLGHNLDDAIVKWYRGIDYLTFTGNNQGGSVLTIPYAPESGYSWSLKLIGAQLTAAGALGVYLGETRTLPIGAANSVNDGNFDCIVTWSSEQVVIKDRGVTIQAGAQGINGWVMMVKQVPTEMQGKL